MKEKTDLRILKTQKALCDSFSELLEEKRFEDITVNELCEKAMIRRATFYKHFADKYDFFAFFIRRIQGEFNEKIRNYEEDGRNSYYVYIFRECVYFIRSHQNIAGSIIKSNMFPALLEILSDEVQRNLLSRLEEDAQKYGADIPVKLLAAFYTGGIIQVLRYWLTSTDPVPEEELVAQMQQIISSYQVA